MLFGASLDTEMLALRDLLRWSEAAEQEGARTQATCWAERGQSHAGAVTGRSDADTELVETHCDALEAAVLVHNGVRSSSSPTNSISKVLNPHHGAWSWSKNVRMSVPLSHVYGRVLMSD